MTSERYRKLRQLAKLMNQQNITGIPVTRQLLECFDVVITPEENDFLLKMGRERFTFEQAFSDSNLTKDDFSNFLTGMLKKGILWSEYANDGTEYFRLAPILVGWFEIYLSDGQETEQKKEFARRVDKLFKFWGKFNRFPARGLLNMRVGKGTPHKQVFTAAKKEEKKSVKVQLNRKVEASDTQIYPAKSVFELIEKYGDKNEIAVLHCFCRQWHKMVDEPCSFDHPAESCIVIGQRSQYIVNYGIGKYISKSEALDLIEVLQKKGAVHQVFHDREDINLPEIAICNCCWDCCGILGSYNRGLLPLFVKAHYLAKIVDVDNCTACGLCVKFCPVNALKLENDKIVLDASKCIGCGQCELKCANGVMKLFPLERDVALPMVKKSEARIFTES